MTNIEEIFRNINPWGRYQIMVLVAVCIYGTMAPAIHIVSFIYVMDTPIHFCQPYEGYSKSDAIPVSKFHSKDIVEYESCSIYRMQNGTLTNETMSCPDGNEYELSEGESTVVNELNLVCTDLLMANTAIAVYFSGVLIGAIIAGLTSDYFGRRNVFLTSTVLLGATGICLTFTTSYYTFCSVWFLTALIQQCVNIPALVLLMETFPPEDRTRAGCITNIMWGAAIALLPMFAYLLRDWRHMQIALSSPCLTSVFVWCFMYESPRWMVSKGRMTEAIETFEKIAEFNKVDCSSINFLAILNESKQSKDNKDNANSECIELKEMRTKADSNIVRERTETLLDIMKSPAMRRSTLVTYYVFLVNSLVYYGMSLNSSSLYGDKYLNTFLVCIVDMPSSILTIFLMHRFNRRPLMSVFFFLAGVFCLISSFTPLTTKNGTNLSPLILVSACLGKFSINASFSIAWLYGTEIFPTELRNSAFGTCSFWARIGSISAPFFVYLNQYFRGASLLCFGLNATVVSALIYFLPETRNKPLPETMEEGEQLHSRRKNVHT